MHILVVVLMHVVDDAFKHILVVVLMQVVDDAFMFT